MRRAPVLMLALATTVSMVLACGDTDDDGGGAEEIATVDAERLEPVGSTAEPVAVALADTAGDLHRQLVTGDENLVLSPHSVAVALAMARAGARGDTLDEIDAALGLTAVADVDAGMNALDQALSSRAGPVRRADDSEAEIELVVANAPFAQQDLALEDDYLTTLAEHYGAALRLVDFVEDAEAARDDINEWVATTTRDRIDELIAPGVLNELTRLVLVNAVHLLAPWEHPFPEEATSPGAFRTSAGEDVTVDLMSLGAELDYADIDGLRAVELPYAGRELSMLVLVPDDLATLEAELGADLLAEVDAATEPRDVTLRLPRFELRTQAGLGPALRALGMERALDPDRADFSGITTEDQLFVSEVVHEAVVSVDEEGTEAAAATAVVMAATGAPDEPVELVVDRPFVFVLRDVETGTILFLGRVADPS